MIDNNCPNFIMLFRCTKRKYAESFQNGKIRLSTPQSWINYSGKGLGIGDELEGVFFSHFKESSNRLNLLEDDVDVIHKNELIYYRRKAILGLKCLCVYGLDFNQFIKTTDENGKAQYSFTVPQSYFSGFSDVKNQETYKAMNEDEQPVVLLIKNPNEFFDRLIKSLSIFGLCERDIIIAPVTYIDKTQPMFVPQEAPYELLLKDSTYKEQSEVRIIINSEKKELSEYLNKNNNVINIGNISDITEISSYYFSEMKLEKYGNRGLMITLPEPQIYNINDLNYFELETLVSNIVRGTVDIRGASPTASSLQEKLKPIIDIFDRKYGVKVFIDGNHINYYNLSNDLLDESKKRYAKSIEGERLKHEAETLLENMKNDEVIELCKVYKQDILLCGIAYYFIGKAFYSKGEYEEARRAFYGAFISDYNTIESLDAIAHTYIKESNYNQAIDIYKAIQDEKGYDCLIWGNMAVCYCKIGEYDNALKVLNRAIEYDPKIAWCYSIKSYVYKELGRFQEAVDCINKAIELEPDNTVYQQQLEELEQKNYTL